MSGTDVSSRGPGTVPMPTDLPVRLYMRALRQYQKLIDLKRFTQEKTWLITFVRQGYKRQPTPAPLELRKLTIR
ncbi:unnamed protein product, partial [Brenthis ino]